MGRELAQLDDRVRLEAVPRVACGTVPVKIPSGKAAFIAAIFLSLRQQRPDFLGYALRLRGAFPPDRLQRGILREDLFNRGPKRCGRTQVGRNRGKNQTLEFVNVAQFSLRHQLREDCIPLGGSHQIEQVG